MKTDLSFAAENVLLAWIRTGLSLMGFGFVVTRCGEVWIGTALVLLGVLVNLGAAVGHLQSAQQLEKRQRLGGILLCLVLAGFGLATQFTVHNDLITDLLK